MKHAEPVSIILPTYNRADKLGDAIGSVLAQNYETFELLVIDSYEDKRVRYYRMGKNSGQSKARNVGMQMAKYDYLAFEDSDDLWRQGKLEAQMDAMLHADPDVGMVYHKFRYDLGDGRGMTLPDEKIPADRKSGDIYAQLLWNAGNAIEKRVCG